MLHVAIIYGGLVGKNVVFVDLYLYSQDGVSGRKNWGQLGIYVWFLKRLIKRGKNLPLCKHNGGGQGCR